MEEERPILKGPVAAAVAAAATSVAWVFLLRLSYGRPRFRGIDGVAARPPSGRPRSPGPSPAPALLFAPGADIEIGAGVVEATVSARQGSGGDR
jgi:hypothetical protein